MYRTHPSAWHHFDPNCPELNYGNRRKNPVVAVDTADLTASRRFCKTCKPEGLPQHEKVEHVSCSICYPTYRRPRPCPHNGGVLVENVETHRYVKGGPQVTKVYRRYRWPENVNGAPLARSGADL